VDDQQRALGFADLHLHQFSHLGFGGRVIAGDPAGEIATDLASCRPAHGPHGLLDVTGNLARVLLLGVSWRALLGHTTTGYPGFGSWPRWDDLTHQAAHRQMLRRAVDGGLRLAVVLALHNEVLYRLLPGRRGPGDDMSVVDVQLDAAHAMERQIDAECGGPGLGWYRIVRTPAEARAVIASGRLAVVLGIEVDSVFDGRIGAGTTAATVRDAVDRYYDKGVRHVLPCHFTDNAFGGAAFALFLQWSRSAGVVSSVNPLGSLPVYRLRTTAGPPGTYAYRGGHRNTQGLTEIGGVLLDALMRKGMMIDADHMSAQTRSDVLDRAADEGYPVMVGHTELISPSRREVRSERQLTDGEIRRLRASGGAAALLVRQSTTNDDPAGTAESFLTVYRHLLELAPDAVAGFGSDINGFAGLPRPRRTSSQHPPLTYPFASPVGGGPMDRATLGGRVLDINIDGVAHVGMLPDFVADLAQVLSVAELEPLMRSASRYVQAWERALSAR
jgi:microsomal dipeptidase-like Zn-dependent dipeptidase